MRGPSVLHLVFLGLAVLLLLLAGVVFFFSRPDSAEKRVQDYRNCVYFVLSSIACGVISLSL